MSGKIWKIERYSKLPVRFSVMQLARIEVVRSMHYQGEQASLWKFEETSVTKKA